MDSGTILHIALLKKLSSHYPNDNVTSRFHHFKKERRPLYIQQASNRVGSKQAFETYKIGSKAKAEYNSTKSVQSCQNTQSFNKLKRKCELSNSDFEISGWNVENEQLIYTQKLKKDKFGLFYNEIQDNKTLIKPSQKKCKPFSYCQEKYTPQVLGHPVKDGRNLRLNQRLLNCSNSIMQKGQQLLKINHKYMSGKENNQKVQPKIINLVRFKTRRTKSNDHTDQHFRKFNSTTLTIV